MLKLRPCDFGVVDAPRKGAGRWLGKAISFVESRDALGDPQFDHAFFFTSPFTILSAEWPKTCKKSLSPYIGNHVLIGRYRYLDDKGRRLALAMAETFVGRRYPFSRLILDFFNLGRFFHGMSGDCSETTVRLLYQATEHPLFENWAGWDPAELADVIRNWRQFEIVFDGILSRADVP